MIVGVIVLHIFLAKPFAHFLKKNNKYKTNFYNMKKILAIVDTSILFRIPKKHLSGFNC